MRRLRAGGALVALLCLAAVPRVPLVPAARAREGETALRVFAAASLGDAFRELARRFESARPGVTVQLNLAGSQQLAAQIAQGAAADVYASADRRWMDHVRERGLLAADATTFARNRLVVIVPRSNPGRIGRLQDLARRSVKLVVAAPAVPAGAYSREAVQKLSRLPGFPPDYARRVLANVVSEEENVRAVVGKVQLGEADAGIVYRSDVTSAVARVVRRIVIPESANVLASYPIAVLQGAEQPAAASDFVALVLSAEGQRILGRHGLLALRPAPAP